jgi:hypothetical protein
MISLRILPMTFQLAQHHLGTVQEIRIQVGTVPMAAFESHVILGKIVSEKLFLRIT